MASVSIISMAAGSMPARDDVADRLAGFVGGVECGQQRSDRLRALDDAQDHLGDHAERSFGADEHAGQIVAGRVQRGAAQLHQLAVREHHFQPST